MGLRNSPKAEVVTAEGQIEIGIALEADFCAEHEWGVKEIQSRLGIRTTSIKEDVESGMKAEDIPVGFDRMTNTVSDLRVIENSSRIFLFSMDSFFAEKIEEIENSRDRTAELKRWLPTYLKDDIIGSWSGNGFMVSLKKNKENKGLVERLKSSEASNNLAVYVAKTNNPFGRGPLVILATELVDPKDFAALKEMDKEHIEELSA
jgi:hypothetical protein